ncbi:MAG: NAD(P)-dependent oxidoreductase [Bacteroidales bacterium]|nr:NAD(P)-dependent oxidoreductase [Bacteroidales bacterium]
MSVLITDDCHPIMQQLFREAHIPFEVCTDVTYPSLLGMIADYDALVVRSKIIIDQHFLDQARHLRCIGRLGAGMETIDVAYAEQLGIRCFNSPEGNRNAVGEHAIALLLALLNHIASADAEVRQGLWRREANRGLELGPRTVGIIGFGNMGAAFAQRLQGFGCRIMAYDKYRSHYAPSYVEECTLEELQQHCDVLSFHVPLTDETHHYLDHHFIEQMAHPFYLVNTARGAVICTEALAQGIRQERILGAALDVNEYENPTQDRLNDEQLPDAFRYLLHSPRCLFTPHVAGWTVESKELLASVLARKIIHHLTQPS